MATIQVDYENDTDGWWAAARRLADSGRDPTFTRVFNAVARHDVVKTPQADAEAFIAVARTLPGWDDGHSFARNPILFDLDE